MCVARFLRLPCLFLLLPLLLLVGTFASCAVSLLTLRALLCVRRIVSFEWYSGWR